MLNKNIGKLIVFSAPSGTGKSSLIKEIISQSSGTIQLSVSATTSPCDNQLCNVSEPCHHSENCGNQTKSWCWDLP